MEFKKANSSKHGHLAATTTLAYVPRKTFCANTNASVCAILKIK